MAKVISQDTYDDVIKENIVEFSMSVDESREETNKQFEAQGINLSNIIKDLAINETTGEPILNETITNLKNHVDKSKVLDQTELEVQLEILTKEISKSVPHRVRAAKNNTQEYLLKLIEAELAKEGAGDHQENSVSPQSNFHNSFVNFTPFQFLHKLILCSHAMTNKNPDLFDAKSMSVVLQ